MAKKEDESSEEISEESSSKESSSGESSSESASESSSSSAGDSSSERETEGKKGKGDLVFLTGLFKQTTKKDKTFYSGHTLKKAKLSNGITLKKGTQFLLFKNRKHSGRKTPVWYLMEAPPKKKEK